MEAVKTPLMTSEQAAEYLTISEPTFFRLVKAGKIHRSRIGPNTTRYSQEELDRYIVSVTDGDTEGKP